MDPAEISDNADANALPAMFERGHLDHVALGAASAEHFETSQGIHAPRSLNAS